MTYGIIGTGAVGGYYGGMLAKAGKEVHFLFHRDYEFVRNNGLQVNSCNGNFHLHPVLAYSATDQMPQCDVVLVALKTVNEKILRDLLPPLLHERTLVVLIQNGIGVEEDVQEWFPGVSLAAGLAFICSAKTEPGVVEHQCYGSINIGNYSCPDETVIATLLSDLTEAGVEARSVEYQEARWRKAVWNMPFNGLTVSLNTQTNKLLENPYTEQLVREMMMEIVRTSRALGIEHIDELFVEKMIQMTRAMVPYSPSMKLDYDFHRPMELYYIYERPLRIAREAGTPMSCLETLHAHLQFLQAHSL